MVPSKLIEPFLAEQKKRMNWLQKIIERQPATIHEVAPVVPSFTETTGDPGAGCKR